MYHFLAYSSIIYIYLLPLFNVQAISTYGILKHKMPQYQSPATSFSFDSWKMQDSQNLLFSYSYAMNDGSSYSFNEAVTLPTPVSDPDNTVFNKLADALHMALGISYYKLFVPSKIETKAPLSPDSANFWNKIYSEGLSEFIYINQLNPADLGTFTADDSQKSTPEAFSGQDAAFLGIGGGKDSIVATELLKTAKIPLTGFVLASSDNHRQIEGVATELGIELQSIERRLDPQLFELTAHPDALNGHVPISLIYALCGLLLAQQKGAKMVVVGNEASASIPQTTWQGIKVNHQWSKSLEFEQLLQQYVHNVISPDLQYFSVLRPLSSVGIMKLFAEHPAYLPHFTSCNRIFRLDADKRPKGLWCGECPKCLSTFMLLAPWLEQDKLVEIYDGRNLLDNPQLEGLFLSLLELEGIRPLDCVGTAEEIQLSLAQIANQPAWQESNLVKLAKDREATSNNPERWEQLQRIQDEDAFPEDLREQLRSVITQELSV